MNKLTVFFVVVALAAHTMSGATADVTLVNCDEYNNLVAGRDGRLVAVFYTAGWCAELCATIGRVFEDFSRSDHYSNLIFLKVDVDQCESFPFVQDIRSLPHFRFFKNGLLLDELRTDNPTQLEEAIKKYQY